MYLGTWYQIPGTHWCKNLLLKILKRENLELGTLHDSVNFSSNLTSRMSFLRWLCLFLIQSFGSSLTYPSKPDRAWHGSLCLRSDGITSPMSNTNPAPLFITVGPPGCGKTTWIRQQGDVKDIALDDQNGVYRALPSSLFMYDCSDNEDPALIALRDQVVFGQSIQQRLTAPDQGELRCICRYWDGRISDTQLSNALQDSYRSTRQSRGDDKRADDISSIVIPILTQVLQECRLAQSTLPATVDLFCREAIFKPSEIYEMVGSRRRQDPNTHADASVTAIGSTLPRQKSTGIDRAYAELRETSIAQAVAWGNTNLRASDYEGALQIASEQRRPVHFCVFDAIRAWDGSTNSTEGPTQCKTDNYWYVTAFDLEAVTFEELLRRNVLRFLRTGRYIPSTVVWDMLQRANTNLRQTTARIKKTRNDLQRALAMANHYEWNATDGTVMKQNTNRKRSRESAADFNHGLSGRYPGESSGKRIVIDRANRTDDHRNHHQVHMKCSRNESEIEAAGSKNGRNRNKHQRPMPHDGRTLSFTHQVRAMDHFSQARDHFSQPMNPNLLPLNNTANATSSRHGSNVYHRGRPHGTRTINDPTIRRRSTGRGYEGFPNRDIY